MLTISQLAKHAGTTVRAVRLYHQRGLLEEPSRAANGYREYRAKHLVRLLQIRRLRDVGIPLRELGELLDASPTHQRATLEALDRELADQARRIADQRKVVRAAIARTDDIRLEPEVAQIMEMLRQAGSPQRTLDESAASFALFIALAGDEHAGQMKQWFLQQMRQNPEVFVRQSLQYEALYDLDPDDPAVEAYVAETFEEVKRMSAREVEAHRAMTEQDTALTDHHQSLLDDVWIDVTSPAQRRADELLRRLVAEWTASLGNSDGTPPPG